jgi:hypothetical protein
LAGALEGLLGHRRAGVAVVLRAARDELARDREAVPLLDRLEHRDRGIHDLDADAVARALHSCLSW